MGEQQPNALAYYIKTVVPLVVELLNDRITNLITLQIGTHISQILEMVELVKSIVATGAMLRSFSQLALLVRGVSIGKLQWLVGARKPPKYL